jgi:hypothetical protein
MSEEGRFEGGGSGVELEGGDDVAADLGSSGGSEGSDGDAGEAGSQGANLAVVRPAYRACTSSRLEDQLLRQSRDRLWPAVATLPAGQELIIFRSR